MKRSQRQVGFTLIEIVLVLAIAGLLLVVVFLAVAGVQRARRDYQRKNDLSTFLADGIKFASENQGKSPNSQSDIDTVKSQYFKDRPDPLLGAPYTAHFRAIMSGHHDEPGGTQVGVINFQAGHWCNNGDNTDPDPDAIIAGNDSSLDRFAVWTKLETGNIICFDSR